MVPLRGSLGPGNSATRPQACEIPVLARARVASSDLAAISRGQFTSSDDWGLGVKGLGGLGFGRV